jgi:hypothetical protein
MRNFALSKGRKQRTKDENDNKIYSWKLPLAPAGGEHVSRAIAFPSIWLPPSAYWQGCRSRLPPSASDLKVCGHSRSKRLCDDGFYLTQIAVNGP